MVPLETTTVTLTFGPPRTSAVVDAATDDTTPLAV